MNRLKPHLALIGCNTIWALNYPIYHIILPKDISAIAVLTLSLVTAAILSFIPLLWSRAERVEPKDIKFMVGAAILSGILRKGLVIFGLSYTSPIDASIIGTLIPIVVLILSIIAGIDRFNTTRVIGIILGISGAIAIIASGDSSEGSSSSLTGNILMVIYTFAAALFIVWLQPIFKRYKPITIMRWVYGLSSLMILPFGAAPIAHTNFSALSPHILLLMAVVVILPTFLPNMLLNYALKRVTPTISSIYGYVQPIVAISLSVWLGLDKLGWSTLIYGCLIITGVTAVIRSYHH